MGTFEAAFEDANAKIRAAQLRGGSTALVLCAIPVLTSVQQRQTDEDCSFMPGNAALWCANCGDTRAVVFNSDGNLTRLSIDHTPDAAGETERVEAAGGEIEFNCLDGVLEVQPATLL